MKRWWIVALLAVVATGVVRGQQTTGAQTSAGARLEAAIKKEVVDGDLKTAIDLYRKLAQAGDRVVAAKALLRMGQCYERLGDTDAREARKAYEQIVREFGDQTAVAAEARTKLATLAGTAGAAGGSTMTVRRVWTGPKTDSMGRVSPDGRFVSFTDWETGDLAIHDVATGQDRRLTDKGMWADSDEFAEYSVPSPDGRQIACNWYNATGSYDLRIIRLDGAKPRVLRNAGEGVVDLYPIAWSPDGRQLLADVQKADGTRDMMLVAVADGSTKLLKALRKDDRLQGGAFSPDGRYIVWAVKDGLSLVELQTGKEYPLLPDLSPHEVLGWTPDGRHILFSSARSGSSDMWVVAVAGGRTVGEPERVKRGHDGYALGFTRAGALYYAVSSFGGDVHIAELDAASGDVITPPKPASNRWVGITRNPDWSPDGRFLAYVRSPIPNDSVIVIRSASTGEERELQVGKMRIGLSLRWAPDGNAIVVSGFETGKGWNLMRVDVQSGQATPLMPLPVNGNFPRFDLSPDGKTIFYIQLRNAPNFNQAQLVARDLQSARETEVIQKSGLYWVSVSPDGQRLLIGAQEGRSLVLRIMPATGGDARELVRIDPEEANGRVWPSWTPDGRHVLFVRGQKGRPTRNVQVWRVAAEGGVPQRLGLTVDELWWLRMHPDGRQVALGTWKTNNEVWVMENFLPKAAAAPGAKAK